MPKSKTDISNSALRIFLQREGKFYGELRSYDKFKPTLKRKKEIAVDRCDTAKQLREPMTDCQPEP